MSMSACEILRDGGDLMTLQDGTIWRCHLCGEERPDDKISVHTHERKMGGLLMKENVRYCNDREECSQAASTFHFVGPLPGEESN